MNSFTHNKASSTSTTAVDRHLSQHTHALIAYARYDTEFAESLASVIQQQNWHSHPTTRAKGTQFEYLIPKKQSQAIRYANWLVETLTDHKEAKTARNTLTTFANAYYEPRNLVLGIVGLAVIGPTLGLIEQKKKKKRKLQLIVERNWYAEKSTKDILKKTHLATQSLLASELRLASGTITKLHPDTAEWIMGNSETVLSVAEDIEMRNIVDQVKHEGLSHNVLTENKKSVLLAISPMVQEEFVNEFSFVDC